MFPQLPLTITITGILLLTTGVSVREALTYSSYAEKFSRAPERAQADMLEETISEDGIDAGISLLNEGDVSPTGSSSYDMGRALFTRYGLHAYTHCPSRVFLGCKAGVISSALAAGGVLELPALLKICREELGGVASCAHGFGHGFAHVANFDAQRGFALCDKYLSNTDDRRTCWLGVLQEQKNVSAPVESLPAEPWAECTKVEQQYRGLCAFTYGTKVLRGMLNLPSASIARLCLATDDKFVERGCIFALGQTIAKREKTAEAMEGDCKNLGNDKQYHWCLMSAAKYVAWRHKDGWNDTSHLLCAQLPNKEKKSCETLILTPARVQDFDAL